MTSHDTDAVVVGGGHNGLVCALLLAQAGKRVRVLERRDRVGGLSAREEIHPGYTLPGVLHESAGFSPELARALGLERCGLTFEKEPAPVFAPTREGKGVLVHRDAERAQKELSALETKDAEAYREWRAFLGRVGGFVARVLRRPPPPLSPSSLADLFELGLRGLELCRLGKDDMVELLRIAPMCVADWLNERFENPVLKAVLAAPAVQGAFLGPWSAGTCATLLMYECTRGPSVKGGPAEIAAALEKALTEATSARVDTSAEVRRILVEGGKVEGVELAAGEVVRAPLVISSADPKRTLLDLVDPMHLPFDVEEPLRKVRSKGTSAKIHLALSRPFEVCARGGERFERLLIAEHVDEIERAFDAAKYRALPERPHLDVWVPTVKDPSLAPAGHDVVSLLVSFCPYDLEGGWTDAAKGRLLDASLAVLEEVCPGVKEAVVHAEVLAPPDLEARYGMTGGHLLHVDPGLDQLLCMRPTPGLARYRTPIEGLFLASAGCHPGGGVSGQPGALAAQAVLKG